MAEDVRKIIAGNDIKNGTKISWVAQSGTAKIGTDGVKADNEHVNTRDTVTNTNRLDGRFDNPTYYTA
jgi:hypothetical protein